MVKPEPQVLAAPAQRWASHTEVNSPKDIVYEKLGGEAKAENDERNKSSFLNGTLLEGGYFRQQRIIPITVKYRQPVTQSACSNQAVDR